MFTLIQNITSFSLITEFRIRLHFLETACNRSLTNKKLLFKVYAFVA